MRSGNTDAKLSVQIITLLKLAIKSLNQIFLEIQLVDTDTTQSWWISTTLFHFLTELIVMNPSYLTYFNSTILPTINAMNDNTQFSQSDQYKAYRTNLLQSVFDQFNYPYSNIRSIYFVWYPKRSQSDFQTIWWAEQFHPTRDDILDCFIPQNKFWRIISTKILIPP